MKKSVGMGVMMMLAIVGLSSGLALAKAAPPYLYAFADTDGDGVYTEGRDLPAVVNEYDGADGAWIEVTMPASVVNYAASASGATSAVLVVPSRTRLNEAKGAVWISTPGSVQIEAGVRMHARTSISILGSSLTVGEGAAFSTAASGDITLDIGDGGVRLARSLFDTSNVTIYVGVNSGNGRNGAFVGEDVTIKTQTMTLGTKEGVSLTDSTVRFKGHKGVVPQAFITTNFSYAGAQSPAYPVDLSQTTLAGPGRDYYLVEVQGSPVITDGMNVKGNCDMNIWP